MAKKTETVFKELVARDLRSLGPRCYFVKIQQVAKRGTPDFFVSLCGHFIALELKKSRLAFVDKLQKFEIEKIGLSGASAHIVSPEEWPMLLAQFKEVLEQGEVIVFDNTKN